MSEDEDYVCPFDEATVKKAQEELNENPHDRLSSVRALRSWINSQPHLSWSADTRLFLTFLRAAKFNQVKAREKMEGMLTVMTQVPEWFQNIDTKDKVLMDVIDSGYITPLPVKDDNGSQILLYRMGAVDPKVPSGNDVRAGIVAANYSLMKDESIDVHGFVFLFDFTGLTRKHMVRWGLKDVKKCFKCWQNNLPGRFKAIHFYNIGSLLDTLMIVIRPFLSEKFKCRIKVHNTLDNLCQHVPLRLLPEEYLPDDYTGSSIGSMQQIIYNYRQDVSSETFRQQLLHRTSSQHGVDFSKKPQPDVKQTPLKKLFTLKKL